MNQIENINLLLSLINKSAPVVNKMPNKYLIESRGNKFFIPYGRTYIKTTKTLR